MNAAHQIVDRLLETDIRRLVSAGLPRGSVPGQIKRWIEGKGWEVIRIKRYEEGPDHDTYQVRFKTSANCDPSSAAYLENIWYVIKSGIREPRLAFQQVTVPNTLYDGSMLVYITVRH